jgi:hypothetical protein
LWSAVGAVEQLLEMCLALEQRQLAEVIAIEIEQIKGQQDDLVEAAFQPVRCTEKSVAWFACGTTASAICHLSSSRRPSTTG